MLALLAARVSPSKSSADTNVQRTATLRAIPDNTVASGVTDQGRLLGLTQHTLNALLESTEEVSVGQGGFGSLHKAAKRPGSIVKFMAKAPRYTIDPPRVYVGETVEYFKDEIALAIAASDIAVAPTVYGWTIARDSESGFVTAAIIMEIFDGDLNDLWREVVEKDGGRIAATTHEAMKSVIEAINTQVPHLVERLVSRGISCWDQKPANMLFRFSDGKLTIVLTDFGGDYCIVGEDSEKQKLLQIFGMAAFISLSLSTWNGVGDFALWRYPGELEVGSTRVVDGMGCKESSCFMEQYLRSLLSRLKEHGVSSIAEIVTELYKLDRAGHKFSLTASHYHGNLVPHPEREVNTAQSKENLISFLGKLSMAREWEDSQPPRPERIEEDRANKRRKL
jgi:hypothetical protein